MKPLSLYIHIPFCVKRCNYCDFNTYAGKNELINDYIAAVKNEIQYLGKNTKDEWKINTIYFGGGTPTTIDAHHYFELIGVIGDSFSMNQDAEISIEANPGTINPEYLRAIHADGINRISIGAQSFNEDELKRMGRIHNVEDIHLAVESARQEGFTNINLDLIYGLPAQRLESWKINLVTATSLHPEHLSLYSLTVEPNTVFEKLINAGKSSLPDSDHSADMYEWACDYLAGQNYEQYEISNWARKKTDGEYAYCKHNLQYWINEPYLGIGAGAHGYFDHHRLKNVCGIEEYIKKIDVGKGMIFPKSAANEEAVFLQKWDEMQETMMMGLRLIKWGVSDQCFMEKFGKHMKDSFPVQISKLTSQKLLEWVGEWQDALRLTERGKLLGNMVFREFVGNPEKN